MRWLLRVLAATLTLSVLGGVASIAGVYLMARHYGPSLPDVSQLESYEPPISTRVHAGDGRLMAEYASEKRNFVPIEAIPDRVKHAFIAAEDQHFYSHPGIDAVGIISAAHDNIRRWQNNRRPRGASTITQQVAKNFLLTNEVSLERKFKEALLAFRIEEAFTKDQILELYLNEIFLGFRAYGVAAAALNYFNKSLDELTVAEAAYLGGVPKAPSHYHPVRARDQALSRRAYVIDRMLEDGYITEAEAEEAHDEPLEVRFREPTEIFRADYFAEEVRRILNASYGEEELYEGGLSVRTTVSPQLQDIADRALRDGLSAYDRRHGWRGPLATLDAPSEDALADWPIEDWEPALRAVDPGVTLDQWEKAVVLNVAEEGAEIGLVGGGTATLSLGELSWARAVDEEGELGPEVTEVGDVVSPGDVVLIDWVFPEEAENEGEDAAPAPARPALRQLPEIEGAVVALNPHTGRILAMSGGFSFRQSKFNRATQALRQPGSSFKPFVYLAALEAGFTPSNIILDAPIVIDRDDNEGKWKPSNYSDRFYGPSPIRVGIEKSRNLMTVRLAQDVGMPRIMEMAERFDMDRRFERNLASALGANEVDLLTLVSGYATLVNGGKRVTPRLIERIQDRHGNNLYRSDDRVCEGCQVEEWDGRLPPTLPDDRETIVDPRHAYQIVSMLEGAVQRGTGVRARVIGKPLAGKTGTTNESRDTWFVGFTPDLVVGVYAGFDVPKPLGDGETGSSVALPIFVEVMEKALEDEPAKPFRVPPGLRLLWVDGDTGLLPGPTTNRRVLEAFVAGTEPTERTPVAQVDLPPQTSVGGGSGARAPAAGGGVSSGGLY
ncbi:MAG: penicillin-binding protein 1A [Geminicoccaceae bacterium]